jgi:hypothetical protein
MGEWIRNSTITDLGTRWLLVVRFTLRPLHYLERSVGPRAALDCMQKRWILSLPVNEPGSWRPYPVTMPTELFDCIQKKWTLSLPVNEPRSWRPNPVTMPTELFQILGYWHEGTFLVQHEDEKLYRCLMKSQAIETYGVMEVGLHLCKTVAWLFCVCCCSVVFAGRIVLWRYSIWTWAGDTNYPDRHSSLFSSVSPGERRCCISDYTATAPFQSSTRWSFLAALYLPSDWRSS